MSWEAASAACLNLSKSVWLAMFCWAHWAIWRRFVVAGGDQEAKTARGQVRRSRILTKMAVMVTAYVVPELLGNRPIYPTLRQRDEEMQRVRLDPVVADEGELLVVFLVEPDGAPVGDERGEEEVGLIFDGRPRLAELEL